MKRIWDILLSLKTAFVLFVIGIALSLTGSLMLSTNLAFFSGIDDTPLFKWLNEAGEPGLTWWIWVFIAMLGLIALSTVLCTLENLGFCKKGEGGAFVENGGIGLGGRLPVNPDGGGLSSNHSGMRGIFLVIEAVRQLRGGLGERQVEGAEVAVAHGTGGYLGLMHSGATLVLTSS